MPPTSTNAFALQSRAFERASLKSESYRVIAMLCLVGAITLFALLRGIATQNYALLVGQIIVLAFVIAHESVMLRAIRSALRDDEEVVAELWVFNVFIESQLPTVALFVLLLAQWMTPYQVLVAPAIILYFLFIILSTLRLSPGLTLLTGFLSALGYLVVTFYVQLRLSDSAAAAERFPFPVYLVYAGLILAAGIIAAAVARQIRGYVRAALREAKLQGELERINHDLDIARSIQRGLLPASSPQLDNFEIAGWNQPADETGGDYFDWQLLPDGQLAISVGDATGHGIGPALVSALCRAYARASFLANHEHHQILERLNSLLANDLADDRFVTFAVVFLNPVTSEIKVLSAIGYLVVAFYVQLRLRDSTAAAERFPFPVYLVYAGLILAAGIIAAAVARQIRGYVRAALREAKLQGELERINHDLDIARSIQRGLLPANSPQLDNFEIAGWNQPADETGGDYFDWQLLPDGQLAISVGDATGHGIGPALVSALCRAYARASFLADHEHHQILERLNSLLANDLADDRFVTFAVVFLNPVTSEIKVLSAGHGPILWYRRASNKLEDVEAQGIPLGMIAGMTYEDSRLKCLKSGDMLVLVTDGFYEWQNPEAEEFGLERLKDTIHQARDGSADEVIAKLHAAVKHFARGTQQNDDLTAVVIKRKITTAAQKYEVAQTELIALMK